MNVPGRGRGEGCSNSKTDDAACQTRLVTLSQLSIVEKYPMDSGGPVPEMPR